MNTKTYHIIKIDNEGNVIIPLENFLKLIKKTPYKEESSQKIISRATEQEKTRRTKRRKTKRTKVKWSEEEKKELIRLREDKKLFHLKIARKLKRTSDAVRAQYHIIKKL